MADPAIVTLAFGQKARACAYKSITSLRAAGCRLPAFVVGDVPLSIAPHILWKGTHPFVTVGKGRYSFRSAIVKSALYRLMAAYDPVMYVDADTIFVADVSEFGRWVEDVDFSIALHQSGCTVRHVRRWYGYHETDATIALAGDIKVPNSGVFIWRRGPAVEFMFETWLKEWKRFLNWDDQFPLMRSLYYTEKQYPEFKRGVLSFGWNSKHLKDATHIHHYFGTGKAAPGGTAQALWAGRRPVEMKRPVKQPVRRTARRPARPARRSVARPVVKRPVRPPKRAVRPAAKRPVKRLAVPKDPAKLAALRRITRGIPLPATHYKGIPAWQTNRELALLERLGRAVPDGAVVVETGTLYGATAAAIATGNPHCRIVSIDMYRWHPIEQSSPDHTERYLVGVGVKNVRLIAGDSMSRAVLQDVDVAAGGFALAAIDGGHTFDVCLADLENLGARAETIAIHDYASKMWISVTQAVTTFLVRHPEYQVAEFVDMLVVLRRR